MKTTDLNTKTEEAYSEISKLEKEMMQFAENLEFEKAADLRDQIKQIKENALELR